MGDALFNPLTYVSFIGGAAATAATTGAEHLMSLIRRANVMSTEKIVDEALWDRYDFIKNSYQQNRDYLINDGNPPEDADPDLLDESLKKLITSVMKQRLQIQRPLIKVLTVLMNPVCSGSSSADKKPAQLLDLSAPK